MAGQDHSTGTSGVMDLEMTARKAIDQCPRCRGLTESQRATRAAHVAIDVLQRRRVRR